MIRPAYQLRLNSQPAVRSCLNAGNRLKRLAEEVVSRYACALMCSTDSRRAAIVSMGVFIAEKYFL